ncbi:hypothetical protein F8M41_005125 [Gigaspora margarita]|uniref:Uncharacterized protein n=1 Tax=Gigaspora margarita TaxID=4874 RepID=A0A8H4A569_GIGMA|nr:hypothetical protein F8M41_005125 [Gigaspora margarita]
MVGFSVIYGGYPHSFMVGFLIVSLWVPKSVHSEFSSSFTVDFPLLHDRLSLSSCGGFLNLLVVTSIMFLDGLELVIIAGYNLGLLELVIGVIRF